MIFTSCYRKTNAADKNRKRGIRIAVELNHGVESKYKFGNRYACWVIVLTICVCVELCHKHNRFDFGCLTSDNVVDARLELFVAEIIYCMSENQVNCVLFYHHR